MQDRFFGRLARVLAAVLGLLFLLFVSLHLLLVRFKLTRLLGRCLFRGGLSRHPQPLTHTSDNLVALLTQQISEPRPAYHVPALGELVGGWVDRLQLVWYCSRAGRDADGLEK